MVNGDRDSVKVNREVAKINHGQGVAVVLNLGIYLALSAVVCGIHKRLGFGIVL